MAQAIGVIFAGGSGTRMNTKSRPKQFLEMNGKPIIIHTLEYFEENENIDAIVISCINDWINYLKDLLVKFHITKVRKIVPGGETGQMSIYNGLCAAKEIQRDRDAIVLIHDGVRPLITDDLITRNIQSVQTYASAITVTPVTETVVLLEENHIIGDVIERKKCYTAKAPQSFFLEDILKVHEKAQKEGLYNMIDSATLMQHFGYKLHVVEGPVENIKITNPADFYLFRALYEARENSQIFGL